jgi:hypothetical protein
MATKFWHLLYHIQQKSLNVIIKCQIKSDNINQMITLTVFYFILVAFAFIKWDV